MAVSGGAFFYLASISTRSVTPAPITGAILSADKSFCPALAALRRSGMTTNLDPRAHRPGATIKLLNPQVKNRSVELAARRRSRFSPDCEVAHTLPRNVSRRVAGPGDDEGTGRWPPEDPPFVKSANGGA